MKKIIFILFIYFMAVTSSYASFFIDGYGDHIATGDYEPVTGLGLGLGFSLTDDVNLLFRSSMATKTEYKDTTYELKYNYSSATVGVEYIPVIDLFDYVRLQWKNSVNVGASLFEFDDKSSTEGKDSKTGAFLSFKTGFQYNFTQVISPFIELGYQKTFFSSSSSEYSIRGWQASLGVRFYVTGSRDYETGY